MMGEFRLKDGREALIRPIRRSDAPQLAGGLRQLSRETNVHRFLALRKQFTQEELDYLTRFDERNRFAIVALVKDPSSGQEKGAGVARWVRLKEDPRKAEWAIVIADEFQGLGLGAHMLALLRDAARQQGVRALVGSCRADNLAIQRLLLRTGNVRFHPIGSGILETELSLDECRKLADCG